MNIVDLKNEKRSYQNEKTKKINGNCMLVSFCVLWSVLVFEVDSTEMSVFQFTNVHRLHDWQVRVSRSDIDVFFFTAYNWTVHDRIHEYTMK